LEELKLKLALIFSVIVVGFIFLAPDPFNPLKDKIAIIDKVGQNIDGLKNDIDSTIDNIGEKFDNVKDDHGLLPQDGIAEEDAVLTETTEEPEIINNGISAKEQLQSKLLKTLQLTTTQEDNGDVKVQYSDSSGNTISVKFTLKNSERELFSGTFYASNFETSITDISNTDHIIEMVVEHKEFGTITSSVYKPAGNLNTMINGVFMTS
jgi:hypothetical protein